MRNTVRNLGFALGLTLTALAVPVHAQSVFDISQVPSDAKPVSNDESALKAKNHDAGSNYQNQIMNDPGLNDRARAEAVMHAGNDPQENTTGGNASAIAGTADEGNTATIVQRGKANTSSVTQKGSNNHATQTQTGKKNELRVEQTGKNNHSIEHQKGNHNHKVKIQNKKVIEEETTDMEEDDPEQ